MKKDKIAMFISGWFTMVGMMYFVVGMSPWFESMHITNGLLMMILGELTDMPKIKK